MLTLGEIKGVGSATLKKFDELGIKSVFELFSFLPSRYVNLPEPISVTEAAAGQLSLFEGEVERVSAVSKSARRSFFVTFSDCLSSSGRIKFKATFFNMPFLHDTFEIGGKYRLLAKLASDSGAYQMVNPQVEKLSKASKLISGVFTQYPLRGLIGQNAFKNIMYSALDSLSAAKYDGALGRVNEDLSSCFYSLHRPKRIEDAENALERLASIDLAIVLSIYKKKTNDGKRERKVFYKIEKNRILDFQNVLSFSLSDTQLNAARDIENSLASNYYMSRILSGDVGSGKTVVAFYAIYLAYLSSRQSALIAPTEILARQHAKTFEPIASALGIRFALLTSSTPARERQFILDLLASGELDCVIGTQALIGEGVKFKSLSLAVIDEQHKFGVNERKALETKGATDILSLTATPIPRSMALTFYDDIAISYIKKREEAATNVKTEIVYDASDALDKIISACERGKQAFIVCPAITDSDGYQISSIESFIKEFSPCFQKLRVACLHGKLSNEEKIRAMQDFADKKTDVLVATSVVEVGIDTLASEILILDADRFGLASLHQLRGRVGRDGSAAHCYLQTSARSTKALDRLSALEKSNDGQYLAEVDFAMRGAGDFIGTKQSGLSLTPIFGLGMNAQTLSMAREYASNRLSSLSMTELLALTRRGEEKVKNFIEALKKVTLNS